MAPRQRMLTVTLELAIAKEPISGRLVRQDGTRQEFIGWLALVRALEEATTAVREAGNDEH